MLPIKKDLSMVKGDTLRFRVKLKGIDYIPEKMFFSCSKAPGSGQYIFQKSLKNGIDIVDTETNIQKVRGFYSDGEVLIADPDTKVLEADTTDIYVEGHYNDNTLVFSVNGIDIFTPDENAVYRLTEDVYQTTGVEVKLVGGEYVHDYLQLFEPDTYPLITITPEQNKYYQLKYAVDGRGINPSYDAGTVLIYDGNNYVVYGGQSSVKTLRHIKGTRFVWDGETYKIKSRYADYSSEVLGSYENENLVIREGTTEVIPHVGHFYILLNDVYKHGVQTVPVGGRYVNNLLQLFRYGGAGILPIYQPEEGVYYQLVTPVDGDDHPSYSTGTIFEWSSSDSDYKVSEVEAGDVFMYAKGTKLVYNALAHKYVPARPNERIDWNDLPHPETAITPDENKQYLLVEDVFDYYIPNLEHVSARLNSVTGELEMCGANETVIDPDPFTYYMIVNTIEEYPIGATFKYDFSAKRYVNTIVPEYKKSIMYLAGTYLKWTGDQFIVTTQVINKNTMLFIHTDPNDTKDVKAGTYSYDLRMKINDDVLTLMRGSLIIDDEVTKIYK